MAFDRFNDKPARREKRDGDRFSGKGGRFEEFGRGRGEGRFGDRGNDRFGARKPFAGRPFKEELGGRSGPRAKVVDKRRFSDRAAFVQNATVRLDSDVARYFKSSEDVNVALRMVIALTKTVKTEETPAKVEEVQSQAIETVAETDNSEEKDPALMIFANALPDVVAASISCHTCSKLSGQ